MIKVIFNNKLPVSKAIVTIAFLFFIIFYSCKNKNDNTTPNDTIVAQVYDRILTKNDIKIDYLANIDKQDSANLIQSYIEHWIRKELLAHNAAKYINNKEEIDRLAQDYKNSLLVETFQKQYIQENLDTVITNQQLKEFYNNNKDNFHLDRSITRLLYAKIDAKKKYLDKFYEDWNNNKYNRVYRYASRNSEKYLLKVNKWYDLDKVKKEIPKFLLKKERKYSTQLNKNNYEYFLKVLETRYKDETIPLSLIESKLKKLIIEKRKSHLIDKYVEKLYKEELENNNIKIYK